MREVEYSRRRGEIAERHYRRGPTRYILIYGVLIWGCGMFVILASTMLLKHDLSLNSGSAVVVASCIVLAICLLSGYMFGWLQWRKVVHRVEGVSKKHS